MKERVLGAMIAIMLGGFLSWGLVVGFAWLVCLCFSLSFYLPYATGIWLILVLCRLVLFLERKK